MDNFKSELKSLLSRYPQVKSVSFDITETITASTIVAAPPATNSIPLNAFHAASPTAAVEAVMANMKKP